jgi:hypothetical protein
METMAKRLKALEAKVAAQGDVLAEAQIQALENAREERQAHGEIETEHPGYLGAQDTLYVGVMKGVGRIYQQTSVAPTAGCRTQSSTRLGRRSRPRTC